MTYEYICTACQHAWEADQSIKDDPLKQCPSCKKQTAKRQISGGTGFVLKGSGWYADLYSSSGGSKSKSDSDSDSSTEKSSESSESDSSSAPKSKESSKSDASKSTGSSKKKSGPKSAA